MCANESPPEVSQAQRGKYHQQYLAATNIVNLDDDVARGFPNAQAGNDALRGLMELAQRVPRARRQAEFYFGEINVEFIEVDLFVSCIVSPRAGLCRRRDDG